MPVMAPRGITGRYYCFHPKIGNSLSSAAELHANRAAGLRGCLVTEPHCYQATLLPSYLAIGLQHSPAGRWLLIDILAAPNRARIIHRVIDGRACSFANMVERFRMDVFRRSFLIPCAGDNLADSFDTGD